MSEAGARFQAGVRWREWDRRDRLVEKEKVFDGATQEAAEAKLTRFCDRLQEKPSFHGFVAWLRM